MKNRIKELCLRDNITNVSTFAKLIGESQKNALLILQERFFICRKLLNRLCDVFNTTPEFILCFE